MVEAKNLDVVGKELRPSTAAAAGLHVNLSSCARGAPVSRGREQAKAHRARMHMTVSTNRSAFLTGGWYFRAPPGRENRHWHEAKEAHIARTTVTLVQLSSC